MDLIYEGITTGHRRSVRPRPALVRMDLIYEGITTSVAVAIHGGYYGQNGPDLRRDYDKGHLWRNVLITRVRMDLIYEGITTAE